MSIQEIIDKAHGEQRVVLTEIEAKQILSAVGIPCTETFLAATRDDAVARAEAIGFPVVLKICYHQITHKSDAGGVKVSLKSRDEVAAAYDAIMAAAGEKFPQARLDGVSVQRMAGHGVEIIMGMIKDPNFGPVLMFGLGGVLVEVLKDVAFRIVPLEAADAAAMTSEIQGKKLLEGYRGQDPADIPFLQEMLLKLSAFVEKTPGIEEIDMNPVFAYKEGAVVVDARIILSSR